MYYIIFVIFLMLVSIESVYFQFFELLDVDDEVLDEKSIILKCIIDNFFLEFFIIEGFELDVCSKKGVVEVVIVQYNNKFDKVESIIFKLVVQLREIELNII